MRKDDLILVIHHMYLVLVIHHTLYLLTIIPCTCGPSYLVLVVHHAVQVGRAGAPDGHGLADTHAYDGHTPHL